MPDQDTPAPRPHAEMSLIVTTLGQAAGLRKLFESLAQQTRLPLEVRVVDQNADRAVVAKAIQGAWPFLVSHLHAPDTRGASRGRNIGLEHARGDLVAFPDDDCWYPPDFVGKATADLLEFRVDFICGRAADETGRTINGRFEGTRQDVTRANVWTTSIEWLQVFRTSALASIGGYDETIGVGAPTPWQSAEAQDLLLRAIEAGLRGVYDPDLVGHHQELPIRRSDSGLRRKLRAYARGMGYVLRRHEFGLRQFGWWVLRPSGGAVMALIKFDFPMARLYALVALGRIEGYFRYPLELGSTRSMR